MTTASGTPWTSRLGRWPVWVAALLAAALDLGLSLPDMHASEPTLKVRTYEIPERGALELAVPAGWREKVERPPQLPPTIVFTPARGAGFHLQITPLWRARPAPGPIPSHEVKTFVEQRGRRILEQAVERMLHVETFGDSRAPGYYFVLTDKAPKPAEPPLLTQGGIGVGELVLTFTLLHYDRDTPERRAALMMLANSRHRR